jgi:MFS family permease
VGKGNSEEQRTLRRNIRDMPGTAWFLIAGIFINRAGSFVILFLALYLTRQLGLSAVQAGTALAAYGVGEVLAGGLGGDLADRLGRRITIIASMLLSSASLIALSQAKRYDVIVGTAFVVGLVSEMYRPASSALVADLVPKGQRVTTFAVVRLASNLGFAIGSAVAAFLATRSFQLIFAADAGSSALFALIAVLTLPPDRPRKEERSHAADSGYRQMFRDRAFMFVVVAAILITFVYYQELLGMPLRVREVGLSNADFGLLLTFNGLLIVLFELPISSITMRYDARIIMALGFALVGIGFSLTGAATTMPMLLGTVLIWSIGEMIGAPVSYAYVADVAPPGMQGRYQGVFGLAWGSGAVTGPLLAGAFLPQGAAIFWPLLAVFGLVAAFLILLSRRRQQATVGRSSFEPPPEAVPSSEGLAGEPYPAGGLQDGAAG